MVNVTKAIIVGFVGLFPILQWSRSYNVDKAVGDFIAGITIALTLIPQSMAYALLAGYAPQYGLYGSFMGGIVYAAMGTCPQINIGPAALTSLLTFTYTHGTNVQLAIFLCFVTGAVEVIAGAAQLGFLVEFVSVPVMSGFTSAAAFTIASSQIKGLLGLKFKANTFIDTWKCIFQHIGETSLSDALLSVACCIVLVGMRMLKHIQFKKSEDKDAQNKAALKSEILWFISISRNAVVVSIATILASILHVSEDKPFRVTGKIIPGLPNPQPPPFQTTINNETYTAGDMLVYLGSGVVVLPLISILTNIAIVRAFGKDKKMEATQEIIALGVCNIVCSFFKSIPVNGSLSRSAVSEASGVKTPAAGIYTGLLVILTLLLLTPYFYYIPRAALASVIVCAILCMVDVSTVKRIWHTSRIDLLPLAGCFFCCLGFSIVTGLICGVILDVLIILYYNSRPPLDTQYFDDGTLPPHYAIFPVGNLHYAGSERVCSRLMSLKQSSIDIDAMLRKKAEAGQDKTKSDEASSSKGIPPLVVHCDALYRVDYTFLQALKALEKDWSRTSRVIWCNARPTLKTQLSNALGSRNFCEPDELKAYLKYGRPTQSSNSSDAGPSRQE